MKWLQKSGIDINAPDSFGSTPMHIAAHAGAVASLMWLLKQGTDINARNFIGNTPIHCATQNSELSAVSWFKNAGADINVRNNDGETPLDIAKKYYQDALLHRAEMLKRMIELLQEDDGPSLDA